MSYVENNKIIAKFMGDADTTSHISYDDRHGLNVEEIPRTKWHYHEKWSWLMPVVEKIESIQDPHHGFFGVFISSNSCTIQGTNLRLDKKQKPPVYYNNVVVNDKLSSTYSAVVSFILWYSIIKQLKELRK